MSAKAPAGSVNRAKGRAESVDINDMSRADSRSLPSTEKAAVLWAATHVPETRAASQYALKTGFLRASQMDVFLVMEAPSPSVERHMPIRLESSA